MSSMRARLQRLERRMGAQEPREPVVIVLQVTGSDGQVAPCKPSAEVMEGARAQAMPGGCAFLVWPPCGKGGACPEKRETRCPGYEMDCVRTG